MFGAERTSSEDILLVSLDLPDGGEESVGLPITSSRCRLAEADEALAAQLLGLESRVRLKPGDFITDGNDDGVARLWSEQ